LPGAVAKPHLAQDGASDSGSAVAANGIIG
jgi:hypothetical protein